MAAAKRLPAGGGAASPRSATPPTRQGRGGVTTPAGEGRRPLIDVGGGARASHGRYDLTAFVNGPRRADGGAARGWRRGRYWRVKVSVPSSTAGAWHDSLVVHVPSRVVWLKDVTVTAIAQSVLPK